MLSKDGSVHLEVSEDGYHYLDRSEPADIAGEIKMRGDKLLIGWPDADSGYAVLSDSGSVVLRQDHAPDWNLELMKSD